MGPKPKAFAAWASGTGVQLQGGQKRWILRKTKLSQILPCQVQGDGFADVNSQLIKRWRFRRDRQIQALRNILPLATEDPELNRSPLYHAMDRATLALLPALADS